MSGLSHAGDNPPDEDSWDQLGAPAVPSPPPAAAAAPSAAPAGPAAGRARARAGELWEWRRPVPADLHYFRYELLCLLGALLVLAVRLRGGRENEEVALAWAREFVTKGALLERNFALCGPGARPARRVLPDACVPCSCVPAPALARARRLTAPAGCAGDGDSAEVLMKESASEFKFYASGRRHCSSLLATLDLRKRQDLLRGYLLAPLLPHDERIDVQVNMLPGAMPPLVLVVAAPRLARELQRRNDGQNGARRRGPPRGPAAARRRA